MVLVKGTGAVVNGNPLGTVFELPVVTAERLEKKGLVEIVREVQKVKETKKDESKPKTTTKAEKPKTTKAKTTKKDEK